MSTVRTLDRRHCDRHGDSLFVSCQCLHCANEGAKRPKPQPLTDPLSANMRRVITSLGSKQDPDRTRAMKRMEKWRVARQKRKTAAEERKARAERWFTPIGSGT